MLTPTSNSLDSVSRRFEPKMNEDWYYLKEKIIFIFFTLILTKSQRINRIVSKFAAGAPVGGLKHKIPRFRNAVLTYKAQF